MTIVSCTCKMASAAPSRSMVARGAPQDEVWPLPIGFRSTIATFSPRRRAAARPAKLAPTMTASYACPDKTKLLLGPHSMSLEELLGCFAAGKTERKPLLSSLGHVAQGEKRQWL